MKRAKKAIIVRTCLLITLFNTYLFYPPTYPIKQVVNWDNFFLGLPLQLPLDQFLNHQVYSSKFQVCITSGHYHYINSVCMFVCVWVWVWVCGCGCGGVCICVWLCVGGGMHVCAGVCVEVECSGLDKTSDL